MTDIILSNRGACPLCSSSSANIYIDFPEIPILKCSSCGFTYSGKSLSDETMTAYYKNNFASKRQMQGQIINSLVNTVAINKLFNVKNIKNILDIGTGYGFLLKSLEQKYNLQVTGVELSKQEADFATNNLHINVINSSLEKSGLPKETYDLASAFEVIEHIPKPIDFINELTQYVRPGGYLIIMTDNFNSRMANSLGAGFPKWIPHSHVSHFSALTLEKTLKSIPNLKIVNSISYTPWEIIARNAYYKARNITKSPLDAFNLETTLSSEFQKKYKLFSLRRVVNKAWAKFNLSKNMDGDLMYFLCQKE